MEKKTAGIIMGFRMIWVGDRLRRAPTMLSASKMCTNTFGSALEAYAFAAANEIGLNVGFRV